MKTKMVSGSFVASITYHATLRRNDLETVSVRLLGVGDIDAVQTSNGVGHGLSVAFFTYHTILRRHGLYTRVQSVCKNAMLSVLCKWFCGIRSVHVIRNMLQRSERSQLEVSACLMSFGEERIQSC